MRILKLYDILKKEETKKSDRESVFSVSIQRRKKFSYEKKHS